MRLAAPLLLLAAAAAAQPQPASADRVLYRDKDGKPAAATAEVKESAGGVQLLVGGKLKEALSPAAVTRIDYAELPGLTRLDLQKAQAFEDGRDPARAAAEFAALGAKAAASDRGRRYAQFREGYWLAKAADAKSGDEFTADAARAAAKLDAVARSPKKNWDCWPAGRLAARLYAELGDFPKAATVFADLAGADLPAELKAEARLEEATAHLRAGAKDRAQVALGQAGKDHLADRRAVLAAAIAGDPAKLQAAIDAVKEPHAKAVGHNLLADLLQAAGKPREALWARLWVDAVYTQADAERVLAVRALAAQFAAQGDADRAEQFRGRLKDVR